MACLSSMFSTAMKEFEWMNENPCRLLSKLPENNARVRFLDDDEKQKKKSQIKNGMSVRVKN